MVILYLYIILYVFKCKFLMLEYGRSYHRKIFEELNTLLIVVCFPAYQTCKSNQFTCSNGRCIPLTWVCDHDADCPENDDEPDNCSEY